MNQESRKAGRGISRKGFAVLSIVFFAMAAFAFAAIPEADPAKPHAPMEVFGMGPELWADRAKAWVEAIALVLDIVVAKVGVLGLAIIAVWQNLRAKAEIKERLDRQGQRIDQVALAVPPVGASSSTTSDRPPTQVPIPAVESQPEGN